MGLSDTQSILSARSQKLTGVLEKMRSCLELSPSAFREILRITEKEYQAIESGHRQLSILSLVSLAERFDLSLESLAHGEIDYVTLANHAKGQSDFIPEKYMVAAYSRRRTLANILTYLERFRGYTARQSLLRRFQLTESAFKNHDAPISALLFNDVFTYLRRRGFEQEDFKMMGAFTINTYANSPLSIIMGDISGPREIYEYVHANASYFERNCNYRLIHLDSESCIIESSSNRDVAEELRVSEIGGVESCYFRSGLFSTFPAYIGLPYSKVSKLSCVHSGDKTCKFKVSFSSSGLANDSSLSIVH